MGCGSSASRRHDYSLPEAAPWKEPPDHAADADSGSDVPDIPTPKARTKAAVKHPVMPKNLLVGGDDSDDDAEEDYGRPPVATLDLRPHLLMPASKRPRSAPSRGKGGGGAQWQPKGRSGTGAETASYSHESAPGGRVILQSGGAAMADISAMDPAPGAGDPAARAWRMSQGDGGEEVWDEALDDDSAGSDDERRGKGPEKVMPPPPPKLHVESQKSNRSAGVYVLSTEEHFKMPVWEKIEGRDKRWIFSTKDGHWAVTNAREDFHAGQATSCLLNSTNEHMGRMPKKMKTWRMFKDPEPSMRITEGGLARSHEELFREEMVRRRNVGNARWAAFSWLSDRQARLLAWWRERNLVLLRERQGRAGVRQEEKAARQDIVVRDRPPRPRPGSAPNRQPRIAAEPPMLNITDEKRRLLLRAAKQKLDAGMAIQPGELAFLVIVCYDTTNTMALKRREWNTLLKHMGLAGNTGKQFAEACRSHGGDPHFGVTLAHLSALLGGTTGMARRITELLFPEEKKTFIGWNVAQFGKLPACACSKVMTLVDKGAQSWDCRLCGRVGVGLRWHCPRNCHGADFCLQCNSLEWVSGGDKERMDAIGGWLLRQKQKEQQVKTGDIKGSSVATARDLRLGGRSRDEQSDLYGVKGRTLTLKESSELNTINEQERLWPSANQPLPSVNKVRSLRSSSSAGLDPEKYPLATLMKDDRRGVDPNMPPPPPAAMTRF